MWLQKVCVHTTFYRHGCVLLLGAALCLLLTFKPTGNGKWFAILETHAEVRRFVNAVFHSLAVSFSVAFRTCSRK